MEGGGLQRRNVFSRFPLPPELGGTWESMTRGEKFAIESLICREGLSAIMTSKLAEQMPREKGGGGREKAKQMISDMCTCGLVYNLFQRPIGIIVRCCDQHCLEIRCWNSLKSGEVTFILPRILSLSGTVGSRVLQLQSFTITRGHNIPAQSVLYL